MVPANAVVAGRKIRARYREVEALGVARLDCARALPAGKVTLVFDYEAAFGDSASGLYRAKVADEWYAWTQFQSIDARAAFPGFDQPGYKTPFTVSLTTRPGDMAISNGAETGSERSGELVRHTRRTPAYSWPLRCPASRLNCARRKPRMPWNRRFGRWCGNTGAVSWRSIAVSIRSDRAGC